MIPLFALPPVKDVEYMTSKFENHPVNLGNVTYLDKRTLSHYPDNIGFPAIEFHFVGGSSIYWRFPQKTVRMMVKDDQYPYRQSAKDVLDTSERDKAYDNIVTSVLR